MSGFFGRGDDADGMDAVSTFRERSDASSLARPGLFGGMWSNGASGGDPATVTGRGNDGFHRGSGRPVGSFGGSEEDLDESDSDGDGVFGHRHFCSPPAFGGGGGGGGGMCGTGASVVALAGGYGADDDMDDYYARRSSGGHTPVSGSDWGEGGVGGSGPFAAVASGSGLSSAGESADGGGQVPFPAFGWRSASRGGDERVGAVAVGGPNAPGVSFLEREAGTGGGGGGGGGGGQNRRKRRRQRSMSSSSAHKSTTAKAVAARGLSLQSRRLRHSGAAGDMSSSDQPVGGVFSPPRPPEGKSRARNRRQRPGTHRKAAKRGSHGAPVGASLFKEASEGAALVAIAEVSRERRRALRQLDQTDPGDHRPTAGQATARGGAADYCPPSSISLDRRSRKRTFGERASGSDDGESFPDGGGGGGGVGRRFSHNRAAAGAGDGGGSYLARGRAMPPVPGGPSDMEGLSHHTPGLPSAGRDQRALIFPALTRPEVTQDAPAMRHRKRFKGEMRRQRPVTTGSAVADREGVAGDAGVAAVGRPLGFDEPEARTAYKDVNLLLRKMHFDRRLRGRGSE